MRALFGFLLHRPTGAARPRLRWPRLLLVLSLLGAAGALMSATAAWVWLRERRGIETVRWVEVAWPGLWPVVRMKIGEQYLRDARAHVQRREFADALAKYRAGLSRSPANLAARLELAELYLAYRRPDLAKQLLLDRLEQFAGDPTYLQRSLQFLFEFQADADLHSATESILRQQPQAKIAALYAATLALHRGDYDRSEALLRSHRLDTTPEGSLLLARLELERGYPELAATRIERLLNEGFNHDDCYLLLAQIRRQLGQTRALERAATLRQAAFPLSHLPRLDFLHLRHEQGDDAALRREIDSYFTHFSEDQHALLALGDFAANRGLPELARRVENHFRAKNWPVEPTLLMSAEARLAAGDFAGGLTLLREHLRDHASNVGRAAPVFDSLQAIALFGLNRADEAQVHLERLLAQPNLRAENLLAIAHRLEGLGKSEHARLVLARAVAVDPLNQAALTELVRLDAQQRDLPTLATNTRRLLSMRRPSPAVLDVVQTRLGSDLQLFHPEQAGLLAEIDARLAQVPPSSASAPGR